MIVLDNGDAIRGIAEVATKLDFTVNGYVGTAATQLADGQISNTEGDLYQSGADATVVTSITVVNTDSAARTFTLYLKPSGGTSRSISPVDLDLGVGHCFYTDGQRMVVMDLGGQVLNGWIVDDTPVNGEVNQPISSNWAYDHENILTTKGDLLTYSTLLARLGVGSNDQVLTADSAQSLGVKWATPASGATKELFVPVTRGVGDVIANIGDFPAASLTGATDNARIAFKVPHDFSSITNAEVIVVPAASQAAANWDIASDYGAEGEAYNLNSESDTATTYNVTLNQIFAVDISGILSSLAAGDYAGIKLTLSTGTHDLFVLGVRFRYS